MDHGGNQNNGTIKIEKCQFRTKRQPRKLSSHKILKKCHEK